MTNQAWQIRWAPSRVHSIPQDWFAEIGSFKGRHPAGEGPTPGLADCQVIGRPSSATLVYASTANNRQHGVERGQMVLVFDGTRRNRIAAARWWSPGELHPTTGDVGAAALGVVAFRANPGQGWNPLLVANREELAQSVMAFEEAHPATQQRIMGNNPRYFVHVLDRQQHCFGLSKFVAFHEASPEQYRGELRLLKKGDATRDHIERLSGLPWKPVHSLDAPIRTASSRA